MGHELPGHQPGADVVSQNLTASTRTFYKSNSAIFCGTPASRKHRHPLQLSVPGTRKASPSSRWYIRHCRYVGSDRAHVLSAASCCLLLPAVWPNKQCRLARRTAAADESSAHTHTHRWHCGQTAADSLPYRAVRPSAGAAMCEAYIGR